MVPSHLRKALTACVIRPWANKVTSENKRCRADARGVQASTVEVHQRPRQAPRVTHSNQVEVLLYRAPALLRRKNVLLSAQKICRSADAPALALDYRKGERIGTGTMEPTMSQKGKVVP
jgi:hypothetical protein